MLLQDMVGWISYISLRPHSNKVGPAFKKVLTLLIAHRLIKNFAKGERPQSDTL